jgi:hypothetical protein
MPKFTPSVVDGRLTSAVVFILIASDNVGDAVGSTVGWSIAASFANNNGGSEEDATVVGAALE